MVSGPLVDDRRGDRQMSRHDLPDALGRRRGCHFAAIGQVAFSALELFGESAEAQEGITAFNR